MKHTMEGFKSRLDVVEETVNGIEIREEEYKEAEAQIEKRISKNERILKELCDQYKWNNIHIIGVPEEEREKRIESVFKEIIAENFPKLGEEIVSQAMEVHRSPNKRDPRKTKSRHMIIKIAKIKDKDRLLKADRVREKRSHTKENPLGYQISQQKPYRSEGSGMI